MKEYVVITILDNTLVFNYRTIVDEEKVFVNKNSLYKDSFYYTLRYYKSHTKSIIENIKKNYNSLNTLKIMRLITFKYVVNLIKELNLSNLVLNFSSTLDLDDYNLFLNIDNIKTIYCYYMPGGVVKKFKDKGVNIMASSIKGVSLEFLSQQDAFENDTLYYKNVIKIEKDYPGLIEDLKEFLKINYNLKAIHVYVYSKELIESIVDLVKNDESRNVIVFLHQGYDKGNFIVNNFEWLRELSEKCKEDYTCEFRIIYANSFLKNNLFKQLTFNNLKLISILCVYVCIVSLVIVKAYEYIEEISVEQLRNDVVSDAYNISNEEDDEYDLEDEDEEMEEEISKEEILSKYTFSNSFKALKKINKETKAYLTVKNTEISYPVVQHSDNNYYLKYDFYKKRTSMGWVYFDYRNNTDDFDDNNIIYGHSMKNGTMFGTLKNIFTEEWQNDKENFIIPFITENEKKEYQVFSIYKIESEDYYITSNFETDNEFKKFIDTIKSRSVKDFNVDVNTEDNILTLSTCANNNKYRVVLHAKMLK